MHRIKAMGITTLVANQILERKQPGSSQGGGGNFNDLKTGSEDFRPRSEAILLTTDQNPREWLKAVPGAVLLPEQFLLLRGDQKVHFRIGPIHLGHLNFGESPDSLVGKEPFVAWCRGADFAVVGCGNLRTIMKVMTPLVSEAGRSEFFLRLDCSSVGRTPGRFRAESSGQVPECILLDTDRGGYHDLSVRIRNGRVFVGLLSPPAYPQLATGGERERR